MRIIFAHIFFLLSLIFVTNLAAQEKQGLLFAVDIIRHGDRTPLRIIPNVPYTWEEGLGRLTAKGMHQEFELGVSFRKNYIDKYHLLPPHYRADTIEVRSTNFDRTLMSAQSLLLGLYPLGTGPYLSNREAPALQGVFQPVPIHPLDLDSDKMTPEETKKFNALLKQYVYAQNNWKEKEFALQKNYARWSQATGFKITNLSELNNLADSLYIYQLHHVALPKDLTPQDIEEIIAAGHFVMAARYKSKAVSRFSANKLLKEISNFLQQASKRGTPLKYVLLSAHDTTLLGIMGALEAPLSSSPPYASNLNFSLFEIGQGHYQVKINFNNKPVSIPACGGGVCSLSQFMALVRNIHHGSSLQSSVSSMQRL